MIRRVVLVMIASLAAMGCFTKTTPEVIACEDAYARLVTCCPGFDASVTAGDPQSERCVDEDYDYTSNGCGSTTTEKGHASPAFDATESACIRRTSCADLVAHGVCDRAQRQRQRGSGTYAYTEDDQPVEENAGPSEINGDAQPPVCP